MPKELSASLAERAAMDELDPLPAILPAEGVVITRLADIAARTALRTDVADVRGSADAAIVAELVRDPASPPAVVIAEDADAARRIAGDVLFLLGRRGDAEGGPDVLVLPLPEYTPYADVNPDRRSAMSRMATLAHLGFDQFVGPLQARLLDGQLAHLAHALFRRLHGRRRSADGEGCHECSRYPAGADCDRAS